MTAHLLDANVLIALFDADHVHRPAVRDWFVALKGEFATCPIVEGALVRFLLRLGESATTAAEVVRRIHEMAACDFRADSISYSDVDLGHVVGHRQVTDAYLVGLARANAATLATLDGGLVKSTPDYTVLLPSAR